MSCGSTNFILAGSYSKLRTLVCKTLGYDHRGLQLPKPSREVPETATVVFRCDVVLSLTPGSAARLFTSYEVPYMLIL
jgi:hypothetical protein